MLHTILDFPFPTIALMNGHTFGRAVPFSLAYDYRVIIVSGNLFLWQVKGLVKTQWS